MSNPEGLPVPSLAQQAADNSGLSPNDFGPKGTLRETDPDRANAVGYDTKDLAEDANYHQQQADRTTDHRLNLESQALEGRVTISEQEAQKLQAKESALHDIAASANLELSEAEQEARDEYDRLKDGESNQEQRAA